MRLLRTLGLSAVAAIVVIVGFGVPAQASEPEQTRPDVAMGVEVMGEPWSAPTFPVTCTAANVQVSCTPTDPKNATEQRCFMRVALKGESATVCTTYEAHVEAIQADGGRALLVQYGCSLGDAVCMTFENAGRGLALGATAMMSVVADTMRFDTSSLLWTAAVGEWRSGSGRF